jgi:predicted nucleic acid-binding Zn ribbon protein
MSGRPDRRRVFSLQEAIASFMEHSGFSKRTFQDRIGRAWCEILGAETARHTRLARTVKRGVLEVQVDSPALLAELSGFRKAEILKALQEQVTQVFIEDIRFRLGSWK